MLVAVAAVLHSDQQFVGLIPISNLIFVLLSLPIYTGKLLVCIW